MQTWETLTPCSLKNFCTFLNDSPVKYNCMADVIACGVACIFSKPRFTVKKYPQPLHWNF